MKNGFHAFVIGLLTLLFMQCSNNNTTEPDDITNAGSNIDGIGPILEILGTDSVIYTSGDTAVTFVNSDFKLLVNALDSVDGSLKEKVQVEGEYDNSSTGTYILTYSVSDNAGNTTKATIVIRVSPFPIPTLKVLGSDNILYQDGDTLSIAIDSSITFKATATDGKDKDISETIEKKGTFDPSTLGNYEITYSIINEYDQIQKVTLTILVRDVTPPTLVVYSVTKADSVPIAHGDTIEFLEGNYFRAHAVAVDSTDGDLSDSVQVTGKLVDYKVPAHYPLTYEVQDSSGNKTSLAFFVRVLKYHPFDSDNDNLIDIYNIDQLYAMRYDLNGNGIPDQPENKEKYEFVFQDISGLFVGYELMNPLNFQDSAHYYRGAILTEHTDTSGAGWKPIGEDKEEYTGVFNGNFHPIQNLYINRPEEKSIGLFGAVDETVLYQVVIQNAQVTGKQHVGVIAGINNSTRIARSSVDSLTRLIGNDNGGGIAGWNFAGTIDSSYSNATVHSAGNAGGIAGRNTGTVQNSFSAGSVSGTNRTGGIVGFNSRTGNVRYSYFAGTLSGTNLVGGLVGFNDDTDDPAAHSYWDVTTTEVDSSGGGVGLSSAELQCGTDTGPVYTNWDKVLWNFGTSQQYPGLSLNGKIHRPFATGIHIVCPRNFAYDNDGDGLIEVHNAQQLNAIRYDLDGDGIVDNTANELAYELVFNSSAGTYTGYELMSPIDFTDKKSHSYEQIDSSYITGEGWEPIGNSLSEFEGNFHGNGNTISNLYINRPDSGYVGLFGNITGNRTIRELGLTNAQVIGKNETGILVGYKNGAGRISTIYTTGSIDGNGNQGGIVGWLDNGSLDSSYSTATVGKNGQSGSVGGLAGALISGSISYSYSTGDVTGQSNHVGGLVGYHIGTIENSFSTSTVVGDNRVGGLVGFAKGGNITTSYYAGTSITGNGFVGGVVGDTTNNAQITNSFWDKTISGITQSEGGTGRTTTNLHQCGSGAYSGWSRSLWKIQTHYYPGLTIDGVLHRPTHSTTPPCN